MADDVDTPEMISQRDSPDSPARRPAWKRELASSLAISSATRRR